MLPAEPHREKGGETPGMTALKVFEFWYFLMPGISKKVTKQLCFFRRTLSSAVVSLVHFVYEKSVKCAPFTQYFGFYGGPAGCFFMSVLRRASLGWLSSSWRASPASVLPGLAASYWGSTGPLSVHLFGNTMCVRFLICWSASGLRFSGFGASVEAFSGSRFINVWL